METISRKVIRDIPVKVLIPHDFGIISVRKMFLYRSWNFLPVDGSNSHFVT